MLGDLNPLQIEKLLQGNTVGRIGCYSNGVSYIVPVTYVYDGKYVYAHSKEGMKIQMMRRNPMVCFEVDKMEDLANWKSVIAWGIYEELNGEEARKGMSLLQQRFEKMKTSETISEINKNNTPHQNDSGQFKAIAYRIKLLEKTGKFERR